MYSFLTRNEYKKPSKIIWEIIRDIQKEFRYNKNIKLRFNPQLIGSVKNRLATKNGDNGEWDFDFNIIVTNYSNQSAEFIRSNFFNILENKKENKWKLENKRKVIKLKIIEDNEAIVSFEFAIGYIKNDNFFIAYLDKNDNQYKFCKENDDLYEILSSFQEIKRNGYWSCFKEAYINKKNNYLSNQEERKSFSIYKEIINEWKQKKKYWKNNK